MTAQWTRDQLAGLDPYSGQTDRLARAEIELLLADHYLWDLWPVRLRDGAIARWGDTQYWMALSAPRSLEPGERHDVATIRLLSSDAGGWADRGAVLGESSPGSREWAGTAVFDEATSRLSLRYTAAGYAGEAPTSFAQRIIETTTEFHGAAADPLGRWSDHVEMVEQVGHHYRSTLEQLQGEAGFIKAFRDPFVFADPADGREHLLFTASLLDSMTDFDAAVGWAVRTDPSDPWQVQAPILHADGVNNEMERPHVVVHGGLYYLFFSTQARTFHPDVTGPTGLYGFVAESMDGEWKPLNGSGLVLRNPVDEPYQCYSWLVLNDLQVASFVDMFELGGRRPEDVEVAGEMSDHFGGTLAPFQELELSGDRAGPARPAER